MVSHRLRVKNCSERGQVNLKSKVIGHRLEILENISGKKRGSYKDRTRAEETRKVLSGAGSIREIKGERFVVLARGNLLPEVWRDIYDWFWDGKVPKDWYDRFNKTAPDTFDDSKRAREMNTSML